MIAPLDSAVHASLSLGWSGKAAQGVGELQDAMLLSLAGGDFAAVGVLVHASLSTGGGGFPWRADAVQAGQIGKAQMVAWRQREVC